MDEALTKDEAFHLLQNPRRRAVLRYLIAHPDKERFLLEEVAEEVAAWEHDTTVQQLDENQRQRVHISLYQTHLPTLADHGVIAYEQDRGHIWPTPLLAVLAPFLGDGLHDAATHLRTEPTEPDASEPSRLVQSIQHLFTRRGRKPQ